MAGAGFEDGLTYSICERTSSWTTERAFRLRQLMWVHLPRAANCAFFCFKYYTIVQQASQSCIKIRTYGFVKLLDVLRSHLRSGHENHALLFFAIACIVVVVVVSSCVGILFCGARRFTGTLE